MHKELAEQSTWQQVAEQSSISRYHFHRQFSELFNETPGQYLSRVRLQIALNLLLNDAPWSVMEIAHYCGFSSSQALGKALKRELGVTAKQVRKMAMNVRPMKQLLLFPRLLIPVEHKYWKQS
ncbi:transcriptional regulator AraC family [Vibrio ponticus]|nr:transcriptional regulator AraC family [Vibrio ponticus]